MPASAGHACASSPAAPTGSGASGRRGAAAPISRTTVVRNVVFLSLAVLALAEGIVSLAVHGPGLAWQPLTAFGGGAWAWVLLVSVLLATAAFLAGRESVPETHPADVAPATPEAPAAVDPADGAEPERRRGRGRRVHRSAPTGRGRGRGGPAPVHRVQRLRAGDRTAGRVQGRARAGPAAGPHAPARPRRSTTTTFGLTLTCRTRMPPSGWTPGSTCVVDGLRPVRVGVLLTD